MEQSSMPEFQAILHVEKLKVQKWMESVSGTAQDPATRAKTNDSDKLGKFGMWIGRGPDGHETWLKEQGAGKSLYEDYGSGMVTLAAQGMSDGLGQMGAAHSRPGMPGTPGFYLQLSFYNQMVAERNAEYVANAGGTIDPVSGLLNSLNPVAILAQTAHNVEVGSRVHGHDRGNLLEANLVDSLKQPLVMAGGVITGIGAGMMAVAGWTGAGALVGGLVAAGGMLLSALGNSIQSNPTTGEYGLRMTNQAAVNTLAGSATSFALGAASGKALVTSGKAANFANASFSEQASQIMAAQAATAPTEFSWRQAALDASLAGVNYDSQGRLTGFGYEAGDEYRIGGSMLGNAATSVLGQKPASTDYASHFQRSLYNAAAGQGGNIFGEYAAMQRYGLSSDRYRAAITPRFSNLANLFSSAAIERYKAEKVQRYSSDAEWMKEVKAAHQANQRDQERRTSEFFQGWQFWKDEENAATSGESSFLSAFYDPQRKNDLKRLIGNAGGLYQMLTGNEQTNTLELIRRLPGLAWDAGMAWWNEDKEAKQELLEYESHEKRIEYLLNVYDKEKHGSFENFVKYSDTGKAFLEAEGFYADEVEVTGDGLLIRSKNSITDIFKAKYWAKTWRDLTASKSKFIELNNTGTFNVLRQDSSFLQMMMGSREYYLNGQEVFDGDAVYRPVNGRYEVVPQAYAEEYFKARVAANDQLQYTATQNGVFNGLDGALDLNRGTRHRLAGEATSELGDNYGGGITVFNDTAGIVDLGHVLLSTIGQVGIDASSEKAHGTWLSLIKAGTFRNGGLLLGHSQGAQILTHALQTAYDENPDKYDTRATLVTLGGAHTIKPLRAVDVMIDVTNNPDWITVGFRLPRFGYGLVEEGYEYATGDRSEGEYIPVKDWNFAFDADVTVQEGDSYGFEYNYRNSRRAPGRNGRIYDGPIQKGEVSVTMPNIDVDMQIIQSNYDAPWFTWMPPFLDSRHPWESAYGNGMEYVGRKYKDKLFR